MIKKICIILPTLISNLHLLFTASGRSELVKNAEKYRQEEQSIANLQFEVNIDSRGSRLPGLER